MIRRIIVVGLLGFLPDNAKYYLRVSLGLTNLSARRASSQDGLISVSKIRDAARLRDGDGVNDAGL